MLEDNHMSLQDARVALLEARMSTEMASFISRRGGIPLSIPAVRESPLDCSSEVAAFIDQLSGERLSTVVFFTGVGASALAREAEKLGRLEELLSGLRHVQVVCRGPKPVAALKRLDIPVAIKAQEPYTTRELLEALDGLDLRGTSVGVIHYGERNSQVTHYLQNREAHVQELCLYEWLLPEDTQALQRLVHEIIEGHVDAVVFTSQIQARHLFLIAKDLGLTNQLTEALNTRTIVASIGPTCTDVLQNFGVTPHVVPAHSKMGHLVNALADYMGA
jgi:uroporphyrinogen-III synthase